MPPVNNERRSNYTGAIPKTKVRNNCNVPQEAVTPTRRDMTTNLVSTSLDWVPVSEYNPRTNYNQSRKPANNISDHEFSDLDNSAFESGFGRFVQVRPLQLSVQNRESVASDHNDDNATATTSGYSLHPCVQSASNGLTPHSNHAPAAVMIVNPTAINTVAGNMPQPFNASGSENRNNLTRNLNAARNHFDVCTNSTPINNNTAPMTNTRVPNKSVNIMNNMYDNVQGSTSNLNENNQNQSQRGSTRALGDAIVAACPDPAAVERRLGQIREYIRVTSSLVDTMRNSEDEDVVVLRPLSVQSNGSGYSENDHWQNEIKSKMEVSQQRLNALHQQQKRLLKYQAEAKHELAELSRARQTHEFQSSTSHDMGLGQPVGVNYHPNRMYAANHVGVAVVNSLTHSEDGHQTGQQNASGGSVVSSNADHTELHQNQDDIRDPNVVQSEMTTTARDSDAEGEDNLLGERGRELAMKLRDLQLKKRHMENLLTDFQKMQTSPRLSVEAANNRYYSSDDSGDEEPEQKCNKAIKKEDPFKLMEIKAIKAALQRTKDLMRSVENYETDHLSGGPEENFQLPNHSNINDVKAETSNGPSQGVWQNEAAACRVRNCLPQRHKLTNEHHSQQQMAAGAQDDLTSLQDLANQLRMESEKIEDERARLRDVISKKEFTRKQKKVNEEVRASTSGVPGPVERRQMELRAILAEKQKQLEALLNKEKVLCSGQGEADKVKPDSRAASVVNQSYNSEQEEPDTHSEQMLVDLPNGRENSFRGSGDNIYGERALNSLPTNIGNTYASDSDSASRSKCNQRTRGRWRQQQERHFDDDDNDNVQQQMNVRHEPRTETPSTANHIPPHTQNGDGHPMGPPFGHLSPNWGNTKSNQDMRTNQFTQNSHSQTMDRIMDPSAFPCVSTMPYQPMNHMMMPYGMSLGCSCGCSMWGSWCWQQLLMQQREIHQLRDQLSHLEERWRAESASHTLNNQVPPGNRANNYWDNFRSYSRQNLLSANSKTNADGHLTVGPSHNPHPLVERSHNTLHASSSTPPTVNTPKRNSNATGTAQPTNNIEDARHSRRNIAYERSLSFSSAPDVLNVNQNTEDVPTISTNQRNVEDNINTNVNINRQESGSNPFRNLNISNSIPEIVQSHSNNLNTSPNSFKKKSSSKLPAKNSANRRNCTLDYSQTSNINIASTSEAPNPNLTSTSRETREKATPKLFDLLRENVYSEVTTLIGVNESHPDFLIQLFRELQMISSDPLRQRVLQSIRTVLSQYPTLVDNHDQEPNRHDETRFDNTGTAPVEPSTSHESNSLTAPSVASSSHADHNIVRFLSTRNNEICSQELMSTLTSHIMQIEGSRQSPCSKKRILEYLSKYEGARMCDVSSEIIDSLPMLIAMSKECDEAQNSAHSEPSILQDVAGSSLFSSSETQLHQLSSCPYELWPGHVHVMEGDEIDDSMTNNSRLTQEGKVDLISEMLNGDLAEADQTCRNEAAGDNGGQEALPDVVDTEETTPTEAEAEWLGLDRVPTRLHMEQSPENQKD